MDLKIEIRKLYALHKATTFFEHGVKEVGQSAWIDFPPSRFIYAFFTFNSIYSYNWKESFNTKKTIKWSNTANVNIPEEIKQIKSYLGCMVDRMQQDIVVFFGNRTKELLKSYNITRPFDDLGKIAVAPNSTTSIKNLAKQFPGQFKRIYEARSSAEEFFPAACAVFEFIYKVRCNLFHGSKTTVKLLDSSQQRRLLIYTAILIVGNSLLFEVTERANIGWKTVDVEFTLPPLPFSQ
jgi:hypothetical protein